MSFCAFNVRLSFRFCYLTTSAILFRIDKYENLNEKTDQKLSEREIEVKQQEEHIRNLQENFLNLQKEKESMQKLVENKQSEITRHDRYVYNSVSMKIFKSLSSTIIAPLKCTFWILSL